VSYQWYKNNAPVGPNNSQYVVSTNAQASDSGTYKVFVTNSVGSVMSSDAVVTITIPPIPALLKQDAVIISYTPLSGYVFVMQDSPTLGSGYTTFSNWFTTVNGQILTATPITSGNQFFRLIQTSP
jgi:hypothetical protein